MIYYLSRFVNTDHMFPPIAGIACIKLGRHITSESDSALSTISAAPNFRPAILAAQPSAATSSPHSSPTTVWTATVYQATSPRLRRRASCSGICYSVDCPPHRRSLARSESGWYSPVVRRMKCTWRTTPKASEASWSTVLPAWCTLAAGAEVPSR